MMCKPFENLKLLSGIYRPLDRRITIRDSVIDGQGVFAKVNIPAGTNLGITHYQDKRGRHGYIRTPLGGFYNHSEEPNCRKVGLGELYELWTLRDIVEGEELTVKYTIYKID